MNGAYPHNPHRPQQQAPPMGPGVPSFQMPPQSPSPRGGPPGVPAAPHHQGPTTSPFHHPLHSPAPPQPRQPQHHPQHQGMAPHHHQQQHRPQMHPSQQQHHHSQMQPPQQGPPQQYPPRSHHHHQQHPSQQGPPQQAMARQGSSSSSHQQQHYMNSGLNGGWQSDKDMHHRKEMIQHILRLLQEQDKNGSREWLKKLPQMVKQLEVSLYRTAPSFEAYADTSTLKHRLQLLAMEIAQKTQQAKGSERDSSRRSDRSQQFPSGNSQHSNAQRQSSHGGSSPFPGGSSSQTQGHSSQDPVLPSHDHHRQQLAQRQDAAQRQRQQQQQQQQRNSMTSGSDRRQVVSMDDINPMMGPNSSSGMNQMSQASPSARQSSTSSNPSVSFLLNNSQSGSSGGSGSMRGSTNGQSGSSRSGNRNDPDWQTRIRHKQQRLLLLHHSSKCPHDNGTCTVTAHCDDMKRLWKHMAHCKDNNCRVSHCFSSRAILSHYRKCKDAQCPACGPVRETVRKSQKGSGSSSSSRGSGGQRFLDPSQRSGSGDSTSRMNQMINGTFPPSGQSSPPSQGDPSFSMSMFNDEKVCQPAMGNSFPSQSQPQRMPSSSNPQGAPFGNSGSTPGSSGYRPNSSGNGSMTHHGYSSSDSKSQSGMMQTSLMPDGQSSSQTPMTPSTARSSTDSSTAYGSQGANGLSSANQRNDPDLQMKMKQRLLLLRHASKCTAENGQCTATPYCARMKLVWKHISRCKDTHCKVQHCKSSRNVLNHYRNCKDTRCPACGPVREMIRKNQSGSSKSKASQPNDDKMSKDLLDDTIMLSNTPPLPTSQQDFKDAALPASSDVLSAELPGELPDQPERKRQRIEEPTSQAEPDTMIISSDPDVPLSDPKSADPPDDSKMEVVKSDPVEEKPPETLSAPPPPPPKPEAPKKVLPVASNGGKKLPLPTLKASEEYSFSMTNSFTVEEIETHVESLNRTQMLPPQKLKTKCMEVLKGLQTHQHGWVFNYPVDPVALKLPDYFDIIKKPMDLGTIQKKIESGSYHAIEDFRSDVRLTFDNAMTYNEDGSVVHDMAKELAAKFQEDYDKLLGQLKTEEEERRKNDRACTLCGCEKLLFEPPVFFCNGMNCPTKRIRRNSHYYVGGNNQYFWCNQCFNELEDKIQLELGDLTLKKEELKKKKNDEVHGESWVQCDTCERWIHQICGLFNTRQNKEHKSEYSCPLCLRDKAKKEGAAYKPQSRPPAADALPRTKLSEWLEQHVRQKVDQKLMKLAQEKADLEKIQFDDAYKGMSAGGPITIRQVTSTDRKLDVRERMKRRYAHKNYPDEFPFRCKCVLVFQNIDGVDVILFALYVYEHGENNPPPNQRTVYVSYLDSVHFMKPRRIRTFVYHEILIAYLDYARQKGFATAHIWACPPLKGDDYIFYAKPEDQKTPKDNRLRQWYIDMLADCQRREICGRVTNMYDLYFANESLDATAVPYLEGDYFPGEAENIIKDLEEGKGNKSGSSQKKSKKKKNSNSSGGSNGASNGNSAKSKSKTGRGGTRSTGIDDEDPSAGGADGGGKSPKEGVRDQVMVKLGDTIQPMKESFIVAFLAWKGAREEDMVVPKDIMEDREKARREREEDASRGKKRDAEGKVRIDPSSTGGMSVRGPDGTIVKIIDDDLEELDCEFFNTRQAFLNLCRGNHYQFDELRRAKHTSMMVLWHLHNRDAPKFVQQCAACNREILSGMRFHCSTCTPDFDLCEECYKNPSTNRGSCTHKLEPIPVEGENNQSGGGNGGSELTEAQRKERQRNIQLHIQLIEHASRCTSASCSSSNCAKMKSYLKHGSTCKVKATGGCKICKRIWTLLRIHAQQCKNQVCPIPQCTAIRERIRQLAKQQQAMDDRRRQEMNRHYRLGAGSQ